MMGRCRAISLAPESIQTSVDEKKNQNLPSKGLVVFHTSKLVGQEYYPDLASDSTERKNLQSPNLDFCNSAYRGIPITDELPDAPSVSTVLPVCYNSMVTRSEEAAFGRFGFSIAYSAGYIANHGQDLTQAYFTRFTLPIQLRSRTNWLKKHGRQSDGTEEADTNHCLQIVPHGFHAGAI